MNKARMSKTTTESKGSSDTSSSTPKSTVSTHDKNMRRYYKNQENIEKLKQRIEKYKTERAILDAKIQDLQKYLSVSPKSEAAEETDK